MAIFIVVITNAIYKIKQTLCQNHISVMYRFLKAPETFFIIVVSSYTVKTVSIKNVTLRTFNPVSMMTSCERQQGFQTDNAFINIVIVINDSFSEHSQGISSILLSFHIHDLHILRNIESLYIVNIIP